MGEPLKPRKAGLGLEIWAHGTWDEVEALRVQLGALGTLVTPVDGKGQLDPVVPTPMGGRDRGRYRWHVRVHLRQET